MTKQPDPKQFDVATIRADFPALSVPHHDGVPLVFLDSAASSQKPRQVIQAIDDYYSRYHANVHRGIHKLSEEATAAYEAARIKLKKFIHAKSKREVIFTRGTTDGINLVAQTWGRANLGPDDVVLSTVMEHHSNIVPWQILQSEKGFTLKYVGLNPDGTLDMDEYTRLLRDENVKFVAVMHISNVLGSINPVAEMARMAHENGALILVDGAQSVPHMPVDVQALDADFYSFSGHKMCGPTGIGILYGKRDLLEEMPPYQGGGDMIARVTLEGSTWNELPYKFEAGTPIIAGAIGLGYTVDYLNDIGMDLIHAYEVEMTEYLLERLAEVSFVTVYGPDAAQKGAVAAFTVDGIHAHDIAQMVDTDGVAVRAGHHCAMPLHNVLGVNATARASLYLYNTKQEVDTLVEALYKAKTAFDG